MSSRRRGQVRRIGQPQRPEQPQEVGQPNRAISTDIEEIESTEQLQPEKVIEVAPADETAWIEPENPRTDTSVRTLLIPLETLLYAGIIALGALLRLFELGERPMNPDEASQALVAWSLLQGQQTDLAANPLLSYGSLLTTLIFGASDAAARALPVLFGILLPVLPFFLRREIGRVGALVASAMLAFAPTLVWESRHVGNEIIAQFWGLVLLVAAFNYYRDRSRLPLYAGAIALACLLLSGVAGLRWLPVLIVVPVALSQAGVKLNLNLSQPERRDWLRAGLVTLLTLLLVTTGGFTNLRGVQDGLVEAIGGYVRELVQLGNPALPSAIVWVRLALYETQLLLLFLVAAVWWWRTQRSNVFLSLCVYATLILLVIGTLVRAPQPALIPAILLVSAWLDTLLMRYLAVPVSFWRAFTLGLGFFLVLLFGARWATLFSVPEKLYVIMPEAMRPDLWPLIMLPPLLFIGLSLLAWLTLNRHTVRIAIAGACLAALLMLWVHQLWSLNQYNPTRPYELLAPLQTSPDVRRLREDMDEVAGLIFSRDNPGSNQLPIIYETSPEFQAVLAWYLRDYPRSRPAEPNERSGANVIILPPDQPSPFQAAGNAPPTASRQYIVATRWFGLDGTWYGTWRWLIFRETPTELERIPLVAHVRR